MKSIKVLFERVREQNPYWSDYVCFAEAVTNKGFNKVTLGRAFNKLVPKDDCPDSQVKIFRHLVGLTQKKQRGVTNKRTESSTNDFYTKKGKLHAHKRVV